MQFGIILTVSSLQRQLLLRERPIEEYTTSRHIQVGYTIRICSVQVDCVSPPITIVLASVSIVSECCTYQSGKE